MSVNLFAKKNGVKLGPDLTMEDLSNPDTILLSKRIVLRVVAKYYDIMGLISPLIIGLRILLQKTIAISDQTWDKQLPESARQNWLAALKEFVNMPLILFHRSSKPLDAVGRPWLIGFWDGADPQRCRSVTVLIVDEYIRLRVARQFGRRVGENPNGCDVNGLYTPRGVRAGTCVVKP